jgi:ribonuclease P protein component
MTLLEKYKGGQSNRFPKEERLSSIKLIEELFSKGSSYYLYPFRLLVKDEKMPPGQLFPQVLISVPKKKFKKAVDRNRLRRQIKEAYRLNKGNIFFDLGLDNIPPYLAVVYTAKEKIPYKKLEEKLILILKRLKKS